MPTVWIVEYFDVAKLVPTGFEGAVAAEGERTASLSFFSPVFTSQMNVCPYPSGDKCAKCSSGSSIPVDLNFSTASPISDLFIRQYLAKQVSLCPQQPLAYVEFVISFFLDQQQGHSEMKL